MQNSWYRQIKAFLRPERGVSDLIAVGFFLPIALLLFTAAADFTRVPVTKEHLLSTLEDSMYRAESVLGAVSSGQAYLDGATPAGTALCSYVGSGVECSDSYTWTGTQALITEENASSLINKVCDLAKDKYPELHTGFWSLGDASGGEYAFGFGLARVDVDPDDCSYTGITKIDSAQDCSNTAAFFALSNQKVFDYDSIYDKMAAAFDSGGSQSPGAWVIDNDSSANGPYATSPRKCLPSYWMVGIGFARVVHLFGGFFAQDDLVLEYYLRPLNNPAAIQSADLSS